MVLGMPPFIISGFVKNFSDVMITLFAGDLGEECVFVACLVSLVHGALVCAAVRPQDYYTEPQVYGFRPSPNHECDLGPIGVSGIMTRIYRDVAVNTIIRNNIDCVTC